MGLFDSNIGAFVVGTIIACYLTGITTSQAFTYYTTYTDDRRLYFLLVTGILLIDVFHTAISCYTIYFFCVTSFGDVTALIHSPWSFSIEPAMTGIATAAVQYFYGYRVWMVSGRKPWLPAFIVLLSTVQLCFAIGSSVKIFLFHHEFIRFPEFTYGGMVLLATWLVTASVTDVLITSSLVFYLKKATGDHKHTKTLVDKILKNAIETNGLTCVVATVDAILFIASKDSWHVIPQLTLIKLYFNSVLVSLNSRQSVASQLGNSTQHSYGARSNEHTATYKLSHLQSHGLQSNVVPIRVTMQETITVERDDEKPTSFAQAGEDLELRKLGNPPRRGDAPNW